MTGRVSLLRRALRPPWLQMSLLYVLVLAVLLPLIGQSKRYSLYFRASAHLAGLTERALADSLERAEEAERYFREAEGGVGGGVAGGAGGVGGWGGGEAGGEGGGEDGEPRLHMAVVIVTTVRSQGAEHRYYLQVAAALHRLLGRCSWCRGYRLMGCNVHPRPAEHWQAEGAASRLVPVVRRFEAGAGGEGQPEPVPEQERFEKEKADYLFCLSRGLAMRPRFVLLLEDDALPSPDLFPVLRDVLERRLASRDPLYVKLYHPERLQGFVHPEPARVVEWAGVGTLGGGLLLYLHRRLWACGTPWSPLAFCCLAALCMLAAEGYGRVYLLEVRRASPQLYSLAPASHCCTPAMAFTARGAARALRYLGARRCRPGYAKDTALYDALGDEGDTAYVVEPNLVSHIGLYSTLRGRFGRPSL